jgi:hypothetical protein
MAAMDNFYRTAGGDPGGHQPTEQFGHEYHWQQPPGRQARPARDRRQARRWTVGIALAALVAGGGVIAGISLASTTLSGAPAASSGTSGNGAAGAGAAAPGGGAAPASQAALLDATLNAADSPGAAVTTSAADATSGGGPPAAGTGAAATAATAPAVRRCAQLARAARAARLAGQPRLSKTARAATARCRFIRRRIVRFFLLRGIDGQFSFRTKTGTVRTLAYVRGVIQSVSNGTSIVVQAADGSTWTWQLVSTTVVRDRTGKIGTSTLAVGEPVWVGGPVVSGVKDARLIFVRPPSG